VPQCQVCKYIACLVILHQFRQDNTQLVAQITFSNKLFIYFPGIQGLLTATV
jgi:hypothetical protein